MPSKILIPLVALSIGLNATPSPTSSAPCVQPSPNSTQVTITQTAIANSPLTSQP